MYDIFGITVKINLDEKQYFYDEEIMSKLYLINTGVRNGISIRYNTTVNDIQLYGKA